MIEVHLKLRKVLLSAICFYHRILYYFIWLGKLICIKFLNQFKGLIFLNFQVCMHFFFLKVHHLGFHVWNPYQVLCYYHTLELLPCTAIISILPTPMESISSATRSIRRLPDMPSTLWRRPEEAFYIKYWKTDNSSRASHDLGKNLVDALWILHWCRVVV